MKAAGRFAMVCALLATVIALVPDAASASTMASVAATPSPAEVGQTVQFTATASADPGSSIFEYDWDFGDGNPCIDCGATPTYSYAASGAYTATVTVYDTNGGSASATVTVHVTPPPRETARSGSVRAELFYDSSRGRYNAVLIRNERIRILRDGAVVSDSVVPSLSLLCPPCEPMPVDYYGGPPALMVRDVDGDSEPEVLLTVSNGGNICCRYTILYSYQPLRNAYASTVQDWLDWGGMPPLRDVGHTGQLEWVGADTRFRYAFSCGACSYYPIQIWRFGQGRFVDVTRRYPALIAKDARKLYNAYIQQRVVRKGYRDVRGILPAYLADEYLLGRGAAGWRVLREAERGGYLVDYPRFVSASEPTPAAYLRQLRRFLRRLGYIR